jgi:hypothetical protein
MAHHINFTSDRVGDDETLFRCVFFGKKHYRIEPNGVLRISSQAFADRNREPSVDRALLCSNDPTWTQKSSGGNENDGVVSLVADEVREIPVSSANPDAASGEPKAVEYNIDVVPAPLQGNHAHAVVRPTPTYRTKSVFRRVCEKLAYLASQRGWVLPPIDLR